MKKDEMGWACSTYGGQERPEDIGRRGIPWNGWEDNIKKDISGSVMEHGLDLSAHEKDRRGFLRMR